MQKDLYRSHKFVMERHKQEFLSHIQIAEQTAASIVVRSNANSVAEFKSKEEAVQAFLCMRDLETELKASLADLPESETHKDPLSMF